MSRKFDTALDDCLKLLREGASVEDCLARYPDHADDLLPLVSLASAVRGVPTPRPDADAVEIHRTQMLDAVEQSAARKNAHKPAALGWIWRLARGAHSRPVLRAALTLAAILLLVGLAAGSLFVSATDSLPGQALYPLKRFGEKIQLSVTLDPVAREQLRIEHRLERQREVRQVLDTGQQAELDFRGELQEIGEGFWIVGGLIVALDDDTVVEGQPVIGSVVIVRAVAPGDGTLQAAKLRALADPRMLTPVATVTPTHTPSPTPTTTPTPSPGMMLTATPTATSTPTSAEPTATPGPSATPTMSASPWPTATYTPTETEEAEPTDHPEEDHTDEPDPTDDPDEEETSEPDATEG